MNKNSDLNDNFSQKHLAKIPGKFRLIRTIEAHLKIRNNAPMKITASHIRNVETIRLGKKDIYGSFFDFWKCVRTCGDLLYFTENFYQLTNIDLSMKDRVCEKYETKSHFFVVTL